MSYFNCHPWTLNLDGDCELQISASMTKNRDCSVFRIHDLGGVNCFLAWGLRSANEINLSSALRERQLMRSTYSSDVRLNSEGQACPGSAE